MDSLKQSLWANSLNVDEIVPVEVRNLRDLMNAIFVEAVSDEVRKLRKEKCCGCLVNHPSQRRHECLMMTEKEGWEAHGIDAVERVVGKDILWKEFFEAIRVMNLDYHADVMTHYQALVKDYEATLYLLMSLREDLKLTEYEPVLNYLSFWIKEH